MVEEANGYRFCSEAARIWDNEASFMNEKKTSYALSKSNDTNSVVVENNADVVADLKRRR